MNSIMDTVTDFYTTFAKQDWASLRGTLSDSFTFRGSMASFDSPDDFVAAMSQLPFEGEPESSGFIVDGNRVAHTFVWKMTSPSKAVIPKCEVLEVSYGKIQSSQLFYDSAAMPS